MRMTRKTWLIALVLAAGCQKNKPDAATESPDGSGDAAGAPGSPSLESLEHELAARNGELSQAADARQAAMSGEGPATEQCERICSIAEAICGLADSICTLADEHEGEPRYAESCTGAKASCEHANEACDACDG